MQQLSEELPSYKLHEDANKLIDTGSVLNSRLLDSLKSKGDLGPLLDEVVNYERSVGVKIQVISN